MITAEQLKAIVPAIHDADLQKYLPWLQAEMNAYQINTPQRIGGFIAQCAHESINFSKVLEDITDAEAERNYGPASREGKNLANKTPGDGAKFKGRGLIQITGHGNYAWCSEDMFKDNRLMINPGLLEQPQFAVESACWFFSKAKPLNGVCDHPEDWTHLWSENGKTYTKFEWMTLLVNGTAMDGLAHREEFYQRARQVLSF